METRKKKGRPKASHTWTPKQLNDAAAAYFGRCDERIRKTPVGKDGDIIDLPWPAPYTVEGLCNHLGITSVTFRNWRERQDKLGDKARMLHQKIADNRITGGLDGTQNSSFARFMLTNNNAEDYREKVDVKASVDENLTSIFAALAGTANKPGAAE